MDTRNRIVAHSAKQAALNTLGKTLRTARETAQLTQQTVAEELNVTAQTVRNWETGKHEPNQETMLSLATLYALHPNNLAPGAQTIPPADLHGRPTQRIKVDPYLLIQARKDAGLSQAKASTRSGISIPSMRRYEQGITRPTRATLRRLALIYGKPPSWLDSACPNGTTILETSQMDGALRTYLELQSDLTKASVTAIADFILFTHQRQPHLDRERHACPLEG